MSDESTKQSERRAFVLLVVFLAPILSVIIVGGYGFLVWMSQGSEIKKTLKDLAFTGVFGAVLASIVLFTFLRRFSTR